jgi:hypothetical protein
LVYLFEIIFLGHFAGTNTYLVQLARLNETCEVAQRSTENAKLNFVRPMFLNDAGGQKQVVINFKISINDKESAFPEKKGCM